MLGRISAQKSAIQGALESALGELDRDDPMDSRWTRDGNDRVLRYAGGGKMLRGALVDLGFRLFRKGQEAEGPELHALRMVQAAMELFQAMLLIHDDIMDQDDFRRGKPSIHAQYRELARTEGASDPSRTGESLAVCLGDVSAFQSFALLAGISGEGIPAGTVLELVALFSRELVWVGRAQMDDVWNAASPEEPSFSAMLSVYRFKTGRYTFSLPLMAGAILGGADPENLGDLARLGELLGIMFQIRDDHIGLFGDPELTGKPRGSDIRENRKTLHRAWLRESADISERKLLDQAFGNPECTGDQLDQVMDLMVTRDIPARGERELELYAREAFHLIGKILPAGGPMEQELRELVDYNRSRRT